MPMIDARLEEVFMQADEWGLWDELATLVRDRDEAGEFVGGVWIWETFKALYRSRKS